MGYRFRREDTGEVVEVDFETHMSQDKAGYITLADGVRARRVNDFVTQRQKLEPQNANMTPPVSDNLGFPTVQLAEFEEHLDSSGCRGVEFKPDPQCPEYCQVHFASHAARDRYLLARGMVDKNRTAGTALSPKDLADAEEYAKNIGK